MSDFKQLKATPYLLNDNSFLFFKNDLGIYAKLLIAFALRVGVAVLLRYLAITQLAVLILYGLAKKLNEDAGTKKPA